MKGPLTLQGKVPAVLLLPSLALYFTSTAVALSVWWTKSLNRCNQKNNPRWHGKLLAFGWITSHSGLPSSFTVKWVALVTGIQECPASQDCYCWNFHRNKCGSICIFWRAADIISFFFLPLSNIPYKKTLAFQVWLWIIASFSNFLHLGALKRLWSSPECRALWGWEDVLLGLPQFWLLPFTNITTSVVLSEQMKEQNHSSPGTGWRGLLWSYLLT